MSNDANKKLANGLAELTNIVLEMQKQDTLVKLLLEFRNDIFLSLERLSNWIAELETIVDDIAQVVCPDKYRSEDHEEHEEERQYDR